ncbi:MAG: thioredoxin family protein [Flavobacteriales bacterium]|nr:thioredoxin family protein [Flavobacteriales bacterium]
MASAIGISGLILFMSFSMESSEIKWNNNFESSKALAKAEKKMILMSFQGSDWCANCMRLEKELFESEQFASFSAKYLVLLKLDFPMRKKNLLPKEQAKHNEALAERYNPKGEFPKVILMDSEGKVLGNLKHPLTSAEAYITNIKSVVK